MSESVHYEIDPTAIGARIDPQLFGHNLEHTRSCMWRGMCSELLRNRKFAGKPQQLNGAAMEWYPIGLPQTYRLLDADDTYTRYYVPDQLRRTRRHNAVHSQQIQGCIKGERSGVGQKDLALLGGREYLVRLAIKGTPGLDIHLGLSGSDSSSYFGQEVKATDHWVNHEFQFSPTTTDSAARLEITFEGIGDLRIGAVSLTESNNFHGMRKDVVELLKEIGTPNIRWPGGNFAGDYRWQDGLLDTDMRAPFNTWHEVETLPHSLGFDFHEVGTDEFLALCREVGAEPFISINLAWDSPEECAAWLEYCNGSADTPWGKLRADRGHPEPYHVKYWSLGNELGYGHMEGPNDVKAYTDKARACGEAMRKIDPSIELVMSGEWRQEQWFTEGLPPMADHVDHIAVHEYDPQLTTYLGPEADKEFLHLAKTCDRTRDRLLMIRNKMNEVASGASVGISFDEWNVWYAWYRLPGVAEGVYAAGMLNMMSRVAEDAGLRIGCYFEPVNEGAIVVSSFESRLTPVGQAMSLHKPHHGNRLVQATCSDPDGLVDGTASIDADSGHLVVTLVNRSPQKAVSATLSFSAAVSLTEGVLLSSEDYAPASVFEPSEISTIEKPKGRVVELPKHSIARLTFSTR